MARGSTRPYLFPALLLRRFGCNATPLSMRCRTIEEAKQHGCLRAELRGSVSVRGRSQLRCNLQSLGGLGPHHIYHTALAQLTSRCFGGADTNRRLLKGQAAELSIVHGHRLSVVQRSKCCTQGAHRGLVTGAYSFRQCLTHTKTQSHIADPMAAPLDPQRDITWPDSTTAPTRESRPAPDGTPPAPRTRSRPPPAKRAHSEQVQRTNDCAARRIGRGDQQPVQAPGVVAPPEQQVGFVVRAQGLRT